MTIKYLFDHSVVSHVVIVRCLFSVYHLKMWFEHQCIWAKSTPAGRLLTRKGALL